jgi:hypothetical protein
VTKALAHSSPARYEPDMTSIYRSVRSLALAVAILLGIQAGATFLMIVALAIVRHAIDTGTLVAGTSPFVSFVDECIAPLSWSTVVLNLAIIPVFLVWLHRSHKNLPALGSLSIKMTPGMAVGGWFIPFANLWRGYASVHYLWVESQRPAVTPDGYTLPRPQATLVGLWWTFYLVRAFGWRLVDQHPAKTLEAWVSQSWGQTALGFIDIVAALLCGLVVLGITRRQAEQHAHLNPPHVEIQPDRIV